MNNACIGVQGGTGHHRRLIEVSEVLWLVHKVLDPWTSKNKGKLPVKVVKPPTHKEKRTSSVQRKPGSKVPKGAGQPMSRAMPTSLAQKRLVKQVEREASKDKGKWPGKVETPPTHKKKRRGPVQRKPGSKAPKGAGKPMRREMPRS